MCVEFNVIGHREQFKAVYLQSHLKLADQFNNFKQTLIYGKLLSKPQIMTCREQILYRVGTLFLMSLLYIQNVTVVHTK